ncbi:MAG: histidinol dehydrogenase 1 [Rhodothalassiaceae bacterium]|nr:MAG: histidinol dehydrogenase 1 [Rhodothalassiaceae bacterium]
MARILRTTDADFAARLDRFLAARLANAADVAPVVAAIIDEVAREGDAALLRLTRRHDRWEPATVADLAVPRAELAAAFEATDPDLKAALALAADRIRAFHARQMPADVRWTDEAGVTLGWRHTPLDSVGLYVPGGLASYPSSVLMNAIPAKVAGVRRLVMTMPTPDGRLNPLVLAAAHLAGVDEVWRLGGAQAVAALACGTASIRPVDKIVGPGNRYVAEAKRQVFGRVGIDAIAGPSEVVVVADAAADPRWAAADLLAQAEHAPDAMAVLVTTEEAVAQAVTAAVEALLAEAPADSPAHASWLDWGLVIVAHDAADAAAIVDRLAPEHLELMVAEPEALAARIRHAGAIFLGAHAPEALGDYIAGPDHVLPTAGTARFQSGLSVFDFIKRSTVIAGSPAALAALGPHAAALARAEGLPLHARSLTLRLREER